MCHPFRRLVVIVSILSMFAVLTALPAQARPLAGGTANVGTQLVSWLLSWWPASVFQGGSEATSEHGGPVVMTPARVGGGAAVQAGHASRTRHRGFRLQCNPATDPNGCPGP